VITSGIGGLGGLKYVTGPVEFVVAAEDAPTARKRLANLDDAVSNEPPEEDPALNSAGPADSAPAQFAPAEGVKSAPHL